MNNRQREITGFLYCTSLLESKTAALYEKLASKTSLPLIKSMLTQMAHDSRKHSDIFKGIYEELEKSVDKPKDCQKRLSQIWSVPEEILHKIPKNPPSESELAEIVEKLVPFETRMGEEYYVLVQAKTLTFMTEQIEQDYGLSLRNVKGIFQSVIKDEEKHQDILTQVARMLKARKLEKQRKDPFVKYQSPDSWMVPPSQTS
jgi:rubrerythrin